MRKRARRSGKKKTRDTSSHRQPRRERERRRGRVEGRKISLSLTRFTREKKKKREKTLFFVKKGK